MAVLITNQAGSGALVMRIGMECSRLLVEARRLHRYRT